MNIFTLYLTEEDEQSSKLPQWVIVSKQNLILATCRREKLTLLYTADTAVLQEKDRKR
jgi:hypothetical protein